MAAHTPCCVRPYHCLECDNLRANREINRLRGVLRVTMDDLIAEREEVKDLNAKVAQREITIRELEISIRLAQVGKISTSKIFPPSYKLLGAEVRRLGLTGEGEGNY